MIIGNKRWIFRRNAGKVDANLRERPCPRVLISGFYGGVIAAGEVLTNKNPCRVRFLGNARYTPDKRVREEL